MICTGSAPPRTWCATSRRPTVRTTRSARALKRFRVLQFLDGYPYIGRARGAHRAAGRVDAEIEGRAHRLKQRAIEILQLLPQVPEDMVAALKGVEGPSRLADFIAGLMDVSPEEKQKLLETFDVKARLDKLLELLTHRIEVLKSVARHRRAHARVDRGQKPRASVARADAHDPEGTRRRRGQQRGDRRARQSDHRRRKCPKKSRSRRARN